MPVSKNIHQLLIKYWGFASFREKQEDIILSVLRGEDILALLPTGGGKSLCFQIPAMAMEGICIVITPLIALMEDQVRNLKSKGIRALSITSAMNKREIDIALDNAAYGNFKFLYVSPERLETNLFKARLKKMNVCMIAVDEAHCISQWGHDFRPSYLRINQLRDLLEKDVPFIALTATATPKVVLEIQEKLTFRKQNVIQKSFARSNLSYVVIRTEDSMNQTLRVIKGVKGSGIIYVSTRKRTKEITAFLRGQGISSNFYHGGLDNVNRSARQKQWIENKSRVMVATNAFGMGIDKPNVRFVIHLDLPESLEAYFQEAGRAGRDGNKAYAVLLLTPSMADNLTQKVEKNFPEIAFIKKVYLCLANYFQIPIGGGEFQSYELDIPDFCSHYKLDIFDVYQSIHFLEKEEYFGITENYSTSSRIYFTVKKEDLYKFQVANKKYDLFIKTLLRTYGGLFENYITINETTISKSLSITKQKCIEVLDRLQTLEILDYEKQSSLPKITYTKARLDQQQLVISKKNYLVRKQIKLDQLKGVVHYAENTTKCRSAVLLDYFGEKNAYRCGICDICLERNKLELNDIEFNAVQKKIFFLLEGEKLDTQKIIESIPDFSKNQIIKTLEFLLENNQIIFDGVYYKKRT